MEKIYMEDSQQSRKSRSPFRLSVVLSFVVAFFAIFSLIACGVSQVSYAAPTDGEIVNDTFNFMLDNGKVWVQGDTGRFGVPLYYANQVGGKSILCIEPTVTVPQGAAYERSDRIINDAGLLYLLERFYDDNGNNENVIGNSLTHDYGSAELNAKMHAYAEAFVKQAAVWVYISKTKKASYPSNLSVTENGDILLDFYNTGVVTSIYYQDRTQTPEVRLDFNSEDVNLMYNSVKTYVNTALNRDSVSTISLTANGDVAKNDEGNYQIIYDVTSTSGSILGYDISVTDANGQPFDSSKVLVQDEEGQEIVNGSVTCTSGTCPNKFIVVVSKDLITETGTEYAFNVKVTGRFESLVGGVYQAVENPDQHQKVVTVSASSTTVDAKNQFIISENTGMTTAQTIYFIGLVVLLCGIGIVYANAKPAESKQ